jgi:hypothetical protein
MSKLVGYNGFLAVIETNDDDTDLDIMNKFVEIAKNNSIEDISEMKLEDITIDDMPTDTMVGVRYYGWRNQTDWFNANQKR